MKRFRLVSCLLIFSIIFTGNIIGKSTQVLIKNKDNTINIGELFRVDHDRILLRNSKNELLKIPLDSIKTIGIKRKSKFWTGVLWGMGIGATIGAIGTLTSKGDKHGLLYSTETGQFAVGVIGLGIMGIVPGALASPFIPKYRYYGFAKYSNNKKIKFLDKLRKKAKFQQ